MICAIERWQMFSNYGTEPTIEGNNARLYNTPLL